jgi:hypothetical protein
LKIKWGAGKTRAVKNPALPSGASWQILVKGNLITLLGEDKEE